MTNTDLSEFMEEIPLSIGGTITRLCQPKETNHLRKPYVWEMTNTEFVKFFKALKDQFQPYHKLQANMVRKKSVKCKVPRSKLRGVLPD